MSAKRAVEVAMKKRGREQRRHGRRLRRGGGEEEEEEGFDDDQIEVDDEGDDDSGRDDRRATNECEASGGSGDEKERERATPTTRITLTDSYMAIWPSTLALPTPHSSPGGAGWRCVLVRSVELCSAVLFF